MHVIYSIRCTIKKNKKNTLYAFSAKFQNKNIFKFAKQQQKECEQRPTSIV